MGSSTQSTRGAWSTRLSVFGVGAVLSCAAFYWATSSENRHVLEVLTLRCDWRADDFANKISEAIAPVSAMAAFVGAQPALDSSEFDGFAAKIHGTAPVSRLAWSPRIDAADRDAFVSAQRESDPGFDIRERSLDGSVVPAARRDEYAAVQFQQFYDDHPTLRGYDFYSEPIRRASAERSRDTGTATVTPAIDPLTKGEAFPNLIVFLPVFREGAELQTVEQRRAALRGFVTGLYRADALARFATANTPEIPETLSVEVATAVNEAQGLRLVVGDNVAGGVDVLSTGMPAVERGAIRIERSFERLGRKWRLTFDFPMRVVAAMTSPARWAFLFLGIPFSLVVAEFVAIRKRSRREIEELVVARTQDLHRATTELEAVIEASPLAIIVLDAHRNAVVWNRSATETFGYTHDEIKGKGIALVPAASASAFAAALERTAAGEVLRGVDATFQRKDGTSFEASLSAARLVGDDGTVTGVVLAVEDRTRQKLIERQLAQAQKMESIGQLTGGLAHDFNNILSVIIGNLELLEDHLPPQSQGSAYRRTGLKAALSAAELVRRLLAFSRRQPLKPAVVRVDDVLNSMQPLIKRVIGESIRVETSAAADLWPATADRAQLESAILNLAINARDAMPPTGGTLSIQAGNVSIDREPASAADSLNAGDYVVIAVSDTGCGMPQEVIARAFEPFFTTKGPHAGSGLGLSMVYGTMRQLGGAATIYSEVGAGTTVRLYLPRAQRADDRSSESHRGAAVPRGRERILLVEDNVEIRNMASKLLAGLGYDVVAAEDAAAAARRARDERFDVLFTDIVMPGALDGIALAQALRERDPNLAILLTSGFTNPEQARERMDALDAEFITKPYQRQELAALLRGILDRKQSQ